MMRRFYRPKLRGVLRDVGLALLIGASIGLVLWIGNSEIDSWWIIPSSAWIGVWVWAVVTLTLMLFSRVLARLTGWRTYLALVPLMFFASAVAFYLGVQSLPALNPFFRLIAGENPPWLFIMFDGPDWGPLLGFSGALGVVVGLMFFRYELLKSRLRRSVDRLKEREHAERELETARKIQQRILGPNRLEGSGYCIAAENRPALYVAGDFYDVSPRRDGRLGLVAADVSGKGMAASLVMASVKGRLPLLAESHSVTRMLSELNRSLVAELGRREFVALCYVSFSPQTGEFEIGNAGLPDPYLLRQGAAPSPLSVPGPRLPLGVSKDIAYESLHGRLEPGERLLLLTDGLPEALLPDGTPLGYSAFEQLLDPWQAPPGDWLDGLHERLEAAVGSERDDDWTTLLLERSDA